MKDWLTHHYFDVDSETLASTIEIDLPVIVAAARRLRDQTASKYGA
jgi:uncharacterized protein with HEPN domain